MSKDRPSPTPEPQSRSTNRRFRHRSNFSRCRDVLAHLRAWEITYGVSISQQDPFASSSDQRNERTTDGPPIPCPDSTLAALAQLCALRMKARTCVVSLVSDKNESILADVNQTTPFQRGYQEVLKDPLLVGTCSFAKEKGVSTTAIEEWRKARRPRDTTVEDGHYYTQAISPHWMIVNDARHNTQLQETQIIQRAKWARFYCAVPLRGAQGSVLGSLAIIHDEPRYGVSVDEMDLLEDISDTIVQHLDTNILRASRETSERLLEGLSKFNGGDSSLREWWAFQDDTKALSTGRRVEKGTLADRQHRMDAEFGALLQESNEQQSNLVERRNDSETLTTTMARTTHSMESDGPSVRRYTDAVRLPVQRKDAAFDLTAASQDAFSRASNLLREALHVEGVVFVNTNRILAPDLQPDSRHKRSRSAHSRDRANGDHTGDGQASSSSDSDARSDGEAASELHGFSTRSGTSLGGDKLNDTTFRISPALLRRLIKRYPNGTIVHFDSKGSAQLISDEESPRSDGVESEHQQRAKRDAQIFARTVPEARTLVFYPLWDKRNQRWRSCIFAWNTSDGKFFDKDAELLYLNTFSHSIFAELERLETVAADQAKGTFISSISHELRSPLHGILAGVELLNETELTLFQQEMSQAINSAGKLLLETIDHILDYSKISTVTRARKPSVSAALSDQDKSMPTSNTTELAKTTEEIVEHCVAIQRSQRRATLSNSGERRGAELNLTSYATVPKPPQSSGSLAVTLTITGAKDWRVRMQPGAWIRIVTNLVGNAIKYTQDGYISIRLQSTATKADLAANKLPLCLMIEDTGPGMSKSFLDHDLFTPFRQEDPHSSGTGLGLSIVKQLADDLGAELSVVSELGSGTKILLAYTAEIVPRTETTSDSDLLIHSRKVEVDMLQLLCVKETGKRETERLKYLTIETVKNSVLENAEDWLECRIVRDTNEVDRSASGNSLCAIMETDLVALSQQPKEVLASTLRQITSSYSSIVVLADTMHAVSLPQALDDFALNHIFVHQPIGPRKLLNAIVFDRNPISTGQSPDSASQSIGPIDAASNFSKWDLSLRGPSSTNINPNVNMSQQMQHPALNRNIATPSSLRRSPGSKATSQYPDSVAMSTTESWSSNETTMTTSSSSTGQSTSRISLKPPTTSPEKTVLLVEDNEINMKLLVALMKNLHVPYRCAVDGREAVNLYKEHTDICLILMDMSMPVMDGYTATTHIRQIEKREGLPRVHIAALTGVTSESSKARAFDCGVDQFQSKPVKMKEIRAMVTKYAL